MKVNNFDDDLRWSHDQSDDPMWERFYRAGFPEFESMEYVEDLALQKKGVDRNVTLRGGKVVSVDEKIRRNHGLTCCWKSGRKRSSENPVG